MLEADQVHDEKIVENVETMQTSADAAVFACLLRLLDLFSSLARSPPPLILPRSLALARALSLPFALSRSRSLSHALTPSPSPSAYPALVTMSNAFGKWHSPNAPPPATFADACWL